MVPIALAIAGMALAAGCGSVPARPAANGAAQPAAGSSASSPGASATTAPAATPPTPGVSLRTPPTVAPPRTVVVREQDNGHAISVRVGEHVQVLLTGTEWQLDGSDNTAVMRQDGQTAVSTQGTGCIPAQGCGTVTATFDAIAAGRADLNARRTSCDPEMSCAGNPGFYRVSVVVAG